MKLRVLVSSGLAGLLFAACAPESAPDGDSEPDASALDGASPPPTSADAGQVDGVGAGENDASTIDASGPQTECSDSGEEPDANTVPDAGGNPPDASEDPSDAGDNPVPDAGDPADAGGNPPDAGSNPPDAGSTPPDAGGNESDGGGPSLQCTDACAAGMVSCSGFCVANDDPKMGCGSCTRCYGSTGTSNGVASATCSNGACAPASCKSGFADCDANPANGCEANLGSTASCGTCGNVCGAGQVCEDGACKATCTFPSTNCGGTCRDLSSSSVACGSCSNSCSKDYATSTCNQGQCSTATCVAGTTMCGGVCRETQSDPTACGASCTDCLDSIHAGPGGPISPLGSKASCTAGACGFSCAVDYSTCGGSCVALGSDASNCGTCGNVCGAGQACVAGVCAAESAIKIVTGLSSPEDIVADGQNLYVTDPGTNSVIKIAKAGFGVTTLGTNQAKPLRIAVDGTHAYWTSNLGGAILRAPIGGGNVEVVLSTQEPTALAIDATHIIFGGANATYLAPKTVGATPVQLSIPGLPRNDTFVRFGDDFYFLAGVTALVRVIPATGAATRKDLDMHAWSALAPGKNNLWAWRWAGFFGRQFAGFTPSGTATFSGDSVLNPTGGNSVTAQPTPAAIVGDDCGSLYFTDGATGIWRYTPSHGWAVRLTNRAVTSKRLAVDDAYVYWTDGSGFVGRVPK